MSLIGKGGIPPGMASMLKMLGVDPAEIMKSVQALGAGVKEIAEALGEIKKQNAQILEQNARLEKKLDRILESGAGENGRGSDTVAAAGNGSIRSGYFRG